MDGYQAFGVFRYKLLAIFCMVNVEVRFGPVSSTRKPDSASTVAGRTDEWLYLLPPPRNNVSPFVNGGSAALLIERQFLLLDSAMYYLPSYDKKSAARAIKQLRHLQPQHSRLACDSSLLI
ncbi:hypothetical protein OIU85_025756 [Salix viminalis]|uniref:Uncharacterized protein n=1 Tax=Salix viminalis TaxID=40686 RepID=A0A9Q0TM59_SALVM|nr:hypothetical protein OIU85_025756 [Salix viminalis]